MKKIVYWVINICIIVSMIIPSGFSESLLSSAKAATVPVITNSGMFRTTIQLKQAYDLTRLNKLDVVVLAQDGMQVDLLVTELQLESLSRLGFEPSESIDLGLLVEANQESSPWLQTALKDKIEQASVLAEENRLSNETTTEVNDLVVLDMIKSFSMEQLAGIQALPGVDNDGDGLTDTQESWWCTDPNNPDSDSDGRSDYEEIQAIKDWMANRRATAPGETPWASWPFDSVTCPDKDYDSIPNLAERWELGLNMDLESTDRDRYDDGQEVFGVTHCPGGDYNCDYGDLPRSSDAGYVGQAMPSWVKAPGNHPFVAAFPIPKIEVTPSSIVVEAVTEITTDHVIADGTEVMYSTAQTQGTGTSTSQTKTWNNWIEVNTYSYDSEGLHSPKKSNRADLIGDIANVVGIILGLDGLFEKEPSIIERQGFLIHPGGDNCIVLETPRELEQVNLDQVQEIVNPVNFCMNGTFPCQNGNGFVDPNKLIVPRDQQNVLEGVLSQEPVDIIPAGTTISESFIPLTEEHELCFGTNQIISYPSLEMPMVTEVDTRGVSRGGAYTTTTEQYEEHTITNEEAFSSEESWGTAVAVDSSHAADLRFTYSIANTGTDYARIIRDLTFNIYLNNDENPITTYFAASDIGGEGAFYNFQPGEIHTFTSSHIPLTLDQMKQIDLGGKLRIVLENFSFGSDEPFYSDSLNGNIKIAIEDSVEDGDEAIDIYFIPHFSTDLITDVLQRYFPISLDQGGNLLAIWTPEYLEEVPQWCAEPQVTGLGFSQIVWCKHSISTVDWWNVFTNNLGDGTLPFEETPVVAGASVFLRFNKDSDFDGFSDRSEKRFHTDPNDALDYPNSELVAGLHSTRTDNLVKSTLSLLNSGLYDAYGVESILIAPDDSITITNNVVGGSGRVNGGKEVIVGSQVLSPNYSSLTWTGTAKPVSGGYFTGSSDLTYSFTISCAIPSGCLVGQDVWSLDWDDGTNSGTIDYDNTYDSPNPISIGTNGLQLSFISGTVVNTNTFTVLTRIPSDTFQYTINYEPHTEPIVIVSYNDPQGNHRFVLPESAMNLETPSDDLVPFIGEMLGINGVEIITSDQFNLGNNITKVVVDNPTAKTIQDGHVFLEFIDPEGIVVLEVPITQDFQSGPNIIEIPWDTASFDPIYDPDQDYIVMAFWTDYEGNILDASGRPLSSFQADPAPEFAITPADETWDFGTAAQGTILKREFSFANTGERTLLTYVDAPDGLLVSQTGSKLIGSADMASYEITINTSVLPVGDFSDIITIHTSDPANPTRTIAITGSITAGEANLPVLLNQLPLDYAVTVPGPQSAGNWHSFTHPLEPDPQSIHPLKVYSQNYSTLYGMGKYAYEFAPGSGGFALFGDGRNGNLTVTSGQNITLNTIRTNITGTAGSTTATVSSSAYFVAGDLVLIHQTQGTSSVGKWEYNYIASISGTTWTFSKALSNAYNSSSGKAQVIKVPQYQNVTVQSGGTLNTPAWDGSTGGILVFVANGVVSIAGNVTANGAGYRLGDRGEYLDPIRSQGWQGESTVAGSVQSYNRNNGGGGGGQGDNDRDCNIGIHFVGGAGGGGGSYGTLGQNGVTVGDCVSYGGIAGVTYGSSNLTVAAFLGSGGGGGGADGDEASRYGGYGGAGGGLIYISGQQIYVTGSIVSLGNSGTNGATGHNYNTGGGGGGSGGAILFTTNSSSFGTSQVLATGGAAGEGYDSGGDGGAGGSGRIYVQYCGTISGTTNPAAVTNRISCHIAEQLETSPYTTTQLQIPESFTTSKTYAIQYGRRLVFTAAGEQTTTLRLPAGYLKSAELDILISNAGVGELTIGMDIGNDGSIDFNWPGTVNNLITLEYDEFATAYNQWWSTNSGQLAGTVDVPVRITLSKAAQILLTDLKISAYGSSLNHIQLESGSYSDVFVDIKAAGTTNPLSLGIDVGDDGTIDQLITVNSPSNPHNITSNNLASQVNTYLTGHTGLVDVPIRIFFFNADQAGITNFSASIIGNKDVSLSVSDITLPAADPMETDVVPVSATFHNSGDLPTGNFTAGFFASTPEVGEWYIGSALLPSIQPGQTASAEIMWNTAGFTGLTTVKVYADPFDHIEETSEENNLAVGEVYVRTRPDLSVTAINPSDPEPMIGELIQIAIVEKNLGETDAVTSTLALYDGNPEEEGVLIGEQNAGLIGGSETNFTFDWQPQKTGWHRLYVRSDVTNTIDEFDEANNLAWHDIYVGLAGPILLDSGTASDPVYTEEIGYGYIDIGLADQITSCNVGNLAEDTIRRDPDGTVLYQFDHLLPGHFYHLDITLFECDGAGRQEYIFVDDNQIAGPEDLGDSQVHRLSLRLDPAFYVDRSVTIAIKADGIDGAVVSEVNLHDIDYRYADAGGGNDPQYPGEEAYGWLDGDAITTWGVLPYQSVRVDQIDSELRYRYDDLDPEKRYNVHFTFWQPSGTGRVLKVQVDGLDTGLVVNTGDYQRHQEKISIPVNAYSTDGSVVISIVRTNASSGAMVNEIALEEETVFTNTNCIVQPTPYFSETYGSVLISGGNAPVGSVVQALNPRGETVGCFTVTDEGLYGLMRIYGEDTSAIPPIPGMRDGEIVSYSVNGAPAVASPLFYWSDDHSVHSVNLNAGNVTGQSILLQPGWNLISFNVEPPAPIVSTVLQSIASRYDRVLGENGVYIPSLPSEFNTLKELHSATGYYLRVTGTTSLSLLVEGIAQACSEPKELHTGWNWIGAPCAVTPTASALSSIEGHYQRVLSLDKTYDPALPGFSTLKFLIPGEGYLIYMIDPATLIYPDVKMNTDTVDEAVEDSCSRVSATPFSTLAYGYIHINKELAVEGSLVEFITPRGEVAGCSLVTTGGILPLTQIYGADGEDVNGFLEGEEIFVRVDGIIASGPLEFTWQDDKTPHELSINVTIHKISLPLITH